MNVRRSARLRREQDEAARAEELAHVARFARAAVWGLGAAALIWGALVAAAVLS